MTPTENPPTVFVVDDDRQMRDSLEALLTARGVEVRTFSGGGAFERYYRGEMPGCLLLDVWMPTLGGLALYEQLLADNIQLPVIFMTAHADVSVAVAAMKTGAIEFLEKPFDSDVLFDRIQKAFAFDAAYRRREADYAALQDRIDQLTERDRQTLDLLLAGDSNKSMAAKLDLTERAVEMRRAALMRRLDVTSLVELLDLALTHRIRGELRQATQSTLRPF